jgi:hypothetical protein
MVVFGRFRHPPILEAAELQRGSSDTWSFFPDGRGSNPTGWRVPSKSKFWGQRADYAKLRPQYFIICAEKPKNNNKLLNKKQNKKTWYQARRSEPNRQIFQD